MINIDDKSYNINKSLRFIREFVNTTRVTKYLEVMIVAVALTS